MEDLWDGLSVNAYAYTPSAKTIPDIKGSRQEGEIRNTRNYRLLLSRSALAPGAYCVCSHAEGYSTFVPVEGERSGRDGQKGAGRRILIY